MDPDAEQSIRYTRNTRMVKVIYPGSVFFYVWSLCCGVSHCLGGGCKHFQTQRGGHLAGVFRKVGAHHSRLAGVELETPASVYQSTIVDHSRWAGSQSLKTAVKHQERDEVVSVI
jgi:hypothetical protein